MFDPETVIIGSALEDGAECCRAQRPTRKDLLKGPLVKHRVCGGGPPREPSPCPPCAWSDRSCPVLRPSSTFGQRSVGEPFFVELLGIDEQKTQNHVLRNLFGTLRETPGTSLRELFRDLFGTLCETPGKSENSCFCSVFSELLESSPNSVPWQVMTFITLKRFSDGLEILEGSHPRPAPPRAS